MYRSSDRILIEKLGLKLGLKQGEKFNSFRPHEYIENGEVLGPFPKNYIKDYEHVEFSDPFLKALYKTSTIWSYQNEWRYLIDKIDTYFNFLFPGSYEWKEIEIPRIFKVKLNEQFFKNAKILFHSKYCSMHDLTNFHNVEDFQKADTHQRDNENINISELI